MRAMICPILVGLLVFYDSAQRYKRINPLHKGPYPLSNSGMIGARIGRPAILALILAPITLWVLPYSLGNWATDCQATAVAVRLGTADLYQACLIFHRGRPSPGDESAWL